MKNSIKRYIHILLLRALYKVKTGERATHQFFYSKNQDDIPFNNSVTKFKGVVYSECSEFKNGNSNWSDAVLLGVGTYNDITSINNTCVQY